MGKEIRAYLNRVEKPNWYDFYWDVRLGRVTFTLTNTGSNDWFFDMCETEPYALDGEVPLLFVFLGYFWITIESKRLYKYFYKRKYGWIPYAFIKEEKND